MNEKERIQEAYEKMLNENNTIFDVADIFTRFLIGDRKMAIRQLTQLEKKPIKGIDNKGGLLDSVLDDSGDMKKWNELFGNLRNDFKKAIDGRS